ncbi:hypothetical protein Yalta_137 [Yalta virus]|nr:hypothetical protein Yalta_137 [Yalta virus]
MSHLKKTNMNEKYKGITTVLTSAFKNFKPKKKVSINGLLNRLTYIEKNRFMRYDEEKNINVFNTKEYNNALDNQEQQIKLLIEKINENPLDTLTTIFDHNQILFFRIRVKGENKNTFHRDMTIEYLLESNVIRNKEYKPHLIKMFNKIENQFITMDKSMMNVIDNKFYNQTKIIDVNNKEDVFEEKTKYMNKLRQDILIIFILYRNNVINKLHINKFIMNYLTSFKKVLNISPTSNLEEENIKLWASGIRFIEVIADNFKYSNKYTKECFKYKQIVDKLCPSLRFM